MVFFCYFCGKFRHMSYDITIVGYIAGFCTAIAQFPQAYKVIKTGDTRSISVGMYSIMTFGIMLWLIYGILIPDLPMIISNTVCLIPSIYILYMTFRNLNSKKQNL